ncbi:cobalamin biosynthesis protein CbiX [Paenibacillus yonginensis]|uniref:Cobalamin biosynthesis protein CbiX n=1 Tax=Paenibacillus yonginensis TaxID=1462996 RepID=A0A1B1MVL4_9BACL|nr:CbiX/SirB N-terminal domain-containing protein [Paenibacillus yonginensis]ANS73195.1 cobalamin biosynthesis protein CbiX [Paenibacillus yonginensis]
MQPGVLIISHGSPDDAWIKLVDDAVAALKLPTGIPVEASFLEAEGERGIQSGIDRLEAAGAADLVVVPLFVSSGSTHMDELCYALGLKPEPELTTDLARFRIGAGVRVRFGTPMDDDPRIAHMVWDKVRGLSRDPDREVVVLVGHGSGHDGFRQRWEAGMASLAASVQAISGVAAADYGLLRTDTVREKVAEWVNKGYEVIVAPLFLSAGYFTKQVIPSRLEGLTYRYNGEALLPHPELTDWIRDQISNIMDR